MHVGQQFSGYHQQFSTIDGLGKKPLARIESFEDDVFGAVKEQRAHIPALASLPGRRVASVDAHRAAFVRRHPPEFDEDDGALVTERPMRRPWRVAQIPAGRIVPVPIREGAGEHEPGIEREVLLAGQLSAEAVEYARKLEGSAEQAAGLLRKKVGLRYAMNVVPLDPTRFKASSP